jgi:signal transduction histidine kinase
MGSISANAMLASAFAASAASSPCFPPPSGFACLRPQLDIFPRIGIPGALVTGEHILPVHREMQMELAHANRVATTGQLTASIAHEVNQPIAAALTNAQAALRWLDARPPDLDEVRQALARIVRDAHRAGDVIGRIRDLGRLDLGEVLCVVVRQANRLPARLDELW